MAISRMQEPRQLYGLGSLVKSIGKTIKKVVKSPIGKAALIGLGGAGLMGMGPLSGLGGLGSKIGGALFGGAGIGPAGQYGTKKGILSTLMGKIPGGGYTVGAIGSILAASGMSPEEIEETKRDPEKVKIYLRDYYSKTNPDKSAEEVEEFVTTNTSEYAVGGRVGFSDAGIVPGTNNKLRYSKSLMKEYKANVNEGYKGSVDDYIREFYGEEYLDPTFAKGGRVGLTRGGDVMKAIEKGISPDEALDIYEEFKKIKEKYDYKMSFDDYLDGEMFAKGGRVGLESGTPRKGLESLIKGPFKNKNKKRKYIRDGVEFDKPLGERGTFNTGNPPKRYEVALGGIPGMPMGQMRKNKAGTIERDYRETGGFVPVGIKEKADDVPAMLSKNEFVMTADAVRGMGGGSIEKGAQRLYDQMKTAEKRVV